MTHSGKAAKAGLKLVLWSLFILLAFLSVGMLASLVSHFIAAMASVLLVIWAVFVVFCINFFRDPDPRVPADATAIVAPAHGKVDVIDETTEPEFIGGPCRRVSIFLSVFDVHVQNAPIAGKIAFLKHTPGQFLNAMKTESAAHNENVLIGFESNEAKGERICVRLIAGLLARRIVPWIATGDSVARGERTSLIQFGSRVDLYLPLSANIRVKLGDKVRGGETVMANRS